MMVTKLKMIRLTPDVDLPHLLEDAAKSPVFIEQDGVLFRLSREPDAVAAALLDRREPPAPRGENESLLDYLERVRNFIMRGRVFTDDSTELLRQSREERTAELP